MKSRIHRSFLKAVVAALVVAGGVVVTAVPAYAETNPACPSAYQIGTTGYVKVNGVTFASVKQFAGCSKNWGYVFVWESWRNGHSSWSTCVAVAEHDSETGAFYPSGKKCASNRAELWSYGTSTLGVCTAAMAIYGTSWTAGAWAGRSSIRC